MGYAINANESAKNVVVKKLRTLLLDVWQIPKPNLLISVTGGAKSFELSKIQKKRFERGLIRAAQSTRISKPIQKF